MNIMTVFFISVLFRCENYLLAPDEPLLLYPPELLPELPLLYPELLPPLNPDLPDVELLLLL